MSPRTVLVVRHGRSEANENRVIAGGLDTPLAPEGHAQAAALAELIDNWTPLTAIYASPLQRALATAAPAARRTGVALTVVDAWRELSFGDLEGANRDTDPAAREAYENWRRDPLPSPAPGAESLADLEARVRPALDVALAAHSDGETILAVGHNVTNRVLLGALAGWPRSQYATLSLRSRHLYEVTLGPSPTLRTFRLGGDRHGAVSGGFVL